MNSDIECAVPRRKKNENQEEGACSLSGKKGRREVAGYGVRKRWGEVHQSVVVGGEKKKIRKRQQGRKGRRSSYVRRLSKPSKAEAWGEAEKKIRGGGEMGKNSVAAPFYVTCSTTY